MDFTDFGFGPLGTMVGFFAGITALVVFRLWSPGARPSSR